MDGLSGVNVPVRWILFLSRAISLLAVYFALIPQCELALLGGAVTLRVWLWSGRLRTQSKTHDEVRVEQGTLASQGSRTMLMESSLTSNHILQAPLELLSISMLIFLGRLVAYLGLATVARLNLGTGKEPGSSAGLNIVLGSYKTCNMYV